MSGNCEGSEKLGHRAICPPTLGACSACPAILTLNDDGTIPPHRPKRQVATCRACGIERTDYERTADGPQHLDTCPNCGSEKRPIVKVIEA